MKVTIIFILLLLITGCASTIGYNLSVPSENKVAKGITYNFDKFTQEGNLRTESYLSEGTNNYTSVIYFYRAFFKKGQTTDIQLYANMRAYDWCFLDRVYDEYGNKREITLIDREVVSGGYIWEDFAINLTEQELETLSNKDVSFRAIGRKCSVEFKIDSKVSQAFMEAMKKQS